MNIKLGVLCEVWTVIFNIEHNHAANTNMTQHDCTAVAGALYQSYKAKGGVVNFQTQK